MATFTSLICLHRHIWDWSCTVTPTSMSATRYTQTSPVNKAEQLSCSLPQTVHIPTDLTQQALYLHKQLHSLLFTTSRRCLQLQTHVKRHVHTVRPHQALHLQSLNIHTYLARIGCHSKTEHTCNEQPQHHRLVKEGCEHAEEREHTLEGGGGGGGGAEYWGNLYYSTAYTIHTYRGTSL